MRTSCSSRYLVAIALALLPALLLADEPAAQPPSLEFPGGSIAYDAHGARTILSITTSDGRHYQIRLARDSNVARGTPPREVTVIGQLDASAIILTDTYPSIPGGLSYCEAGEEKFLRVISLSSRSATQRYHTKLESCRQNLILATPGVDWQSDTHTLTIHWTSGPKGIGQPETRTVKVEPDHVTVE
jgi:hypothetical protein